ncbi:hypothetical protein SCYAM73S_00945 [Streptomyces cyaneofuscatus]
MSTTTLTPAPVGPVPTKAAVADEGRIGLRANLRHIGALVRRNLLQIKKDPESMFDVLLMPIIAHLAGVRAQVAASIQYQDIDSTMHNASCSSRTATAWRNAVRRFSYSRWKTAMAARCPAPRIFGPVIRASSRKWTRWRRATTSRSAASSRRSAAYSPTVSSSR